MAVSTIFLQTTNEGENEYGDTTFAIHVPAKDKSYKLSVASFMFRPKIILMENQYIDLKLRMRPRWNPEVFTADRIEQLHASFQFWSAVQKHRYHIQEPIQFNPSKTEVTQMKDLITGTITLANDVDYVTANHTVLAEGYIYVHIDLNDVFNWSITPDYKLQLVIQDPYIATNITIAEDPTGLLAEQIKPGDLTFELTDWSITDISPEFQYFSGLRPSDFQRSSDYTSYILTAPHTFNPHYWNYITLSCNKSYNTGNIVNQERFNSDIDESSQFYKGQILAYMPNNAYAPEAMQTGMATANEYIIQPADFNSIRFWLNYDNGEPVKLCSPMTIVLNMMPNQ